MKCHKSFGVRRRRHHCRLCGDIICKQCSSFITLNEACEGLENFFSVNWIVLTRTFSSFLYFLISAQFSELQPDSNLRYHFLLSLR